ncbi:hypothetical protein GQR58_014823 [Nymphon striatum]|nr:hypothetical protein GQR58_014823 [Nymphon striatum]
MCPACTNVWVRDLGNYRYPVDKIGESPTQYGKKPLCLKLEGIRQMCPACTNVWFRDLGNYRYPVEKIGECPTQYGKKPLCLKWKVYDKCVLPVLTYGSETWAITDTLLRKLYSNKFSENENDITSDMDDGSASDEIESDYDINEDKDDGVTSKDPVRNENNVKQLSVIEVKEVKNGYNSLKL